MPAPCYSPTRCIPVPWWGWDPWVNWCRWFRGCPTWCRQAGYGGHMSPLQLGRCTRTLCICIHLYSLYFSKLRGRRSTTSGFLVRCRKGGRQENQALYGPGLGIRRRPKGSAFSDSFVDHESIASSWGHHGQHAGCIENSWISNWFHWILSLFYEHGDDIDWYCLKRNSMSAWFWATSVGFGWIFSNLMHASSSSFQYIYIYAYTYI